MVTSVNPINLIRNKELMKSCTSQSPSRLLHHPPPPSSHRAPPPTPPLSPLLLNSFPTNKLSRRACYPLPPLRFTKSGKSQKFAFLRGSRVKPGDRAQNHSPGRAHFPTLQGKSCELIKLSTCPALSMAPAPSSLPDPFHQQKPSFWVSFPESLTISSGAETSNLGASVLFILTPLSKVSPA